MAGLLLAAGAGRRMGRPKALVELAGEALVRRGLRVLANGGVAPVMVVLGASADQVRPLLPPGVLPVVAADWAQGMGASLRVGLAALSDLDPVPAAVVVHLVDLPGVGADAVRRLVAGAGPTALRRAGYAGVPGHPVLLGSAHWAGARAAAVGDAGARGYLAGHPELRLVECGDVAEPSDVDTEADLDRLR